MCISNNNILRFRFIPALLISMIFCGVVGVLIERIAYKPLRHATRITALITAIGVSYVLEYATQYIMGSEVRTYPKLLTSASFHLGPVTITMQQVYIFVITVILMVVLQFIVQKTKNGPCHACCKRWRRCCTFNGYRCG